MSLRGRLLLLFLLTAFVPFAALLVVVQKSLVEGVERDHRQQLQARVATARRLIERERADDALRVRALCEDDPWIGDVARSLGAPTFEGAPEDARGLALKDANAPAPPYDGEGDAVADLSSELARKARALGLDTLLLLDARGGPDRGRVLGAGHAPQRTGERAPALVDAIVRRGATSFVHPLPGLDREPTPALLVGCLTRQDGAPLAVVGARFLSADYLQRRLGDTAPVDFSLVRDAAEGEEVVRFEDAHGRPSLRLVAHLDDGPVRREIRALRMRTLYIALGALLVAFVAAALTTLSLSKSLSKLEEAAQRVARGDLDSELEERGELGRTMRAFNEMTRELAATRKKLLRAERIAAWREVARRIAHEVKNPLQPIQMEIETMRKLHARRHPDFDRDFEASTQLILDEVRRLDAMVTEFSRFARLPRPRPETLDLREVVEHVTSLLDGGEVRLEVDVERAVVRADREQITQLLVNLVQNAIDAAVARHGAEGGVVRVRLRADDEGAVLEVADNGVGIDAAARLKVFEPYFTTKAHGTGLGLAIVHRIAGDHGGSVDVADGLDGGAAFVVTLPAQGPPPEIEASLTERDLPLGRSR